MIDYKWDSRKIKDMQEELKIKILQGVTTAEQDLNTLKIMLGDQTIKSDFVINDVFNIEIKRVTENLAKDFCQKSLTKHIGIDYIPPLDLNINDYLTLVHDFYKSCCPTIYDAFLKEFDKKATNLQFSYGLGSNAITYHLLTTKESYIDIFLNNTALDLENLPHEYGHAITFLINNFFVTNLSCIFIREVDGYYFQTKFLDYLIENNILKEEAIIAKISEDYAMYNRARFLSTGIFDLKKAIILFSYMLSIELCMKDKEEADDLLIEIVKRNPKTIMEGIGNLNIVVGKNLDNYQKVLKKQLNDCLIIG